MDNDYGRSEVKREQILITNAESIFREFKNRPVCPKCEMVMYRHWAKGDPNHKQGVCPNCGYRGGSVTVGEYVTGKMYR